MSQILSTGTAVPVHRHLQEDVLDFMQRVYGLNETEKRKLRFLYRHSAIDGRYSVMADYSRPATAWKFYPASENLEPFPDLEKRMQWYGKYAAPLSVDAIRACLKGKARAADITHLITVSCTGMSAPGLDLEIMDLLGLPSTIFRTSINFMGCYAAIHALKLADAICHSAKGANVLIVCTELCTLHFQKDPSFDNIASALLFGDGSAAILVASEDAAAGQPHKAIRFEGFYSDISVKGKKDMAWELSSTGFRMTLSNYIPDLVEEDLGGFVDRALGHMQTERSEITHWCAHPGGKRVLEAVGKCLNIDEDALGDSYQVLREYGNMSSASILFVLQRILARLDHSRPAKIFGIALGPGLTMESFIATTGKTA